MTGPEGFELNEGYASFRPTGPTSVERLLEQLKQVMAACQGHKMTRLLVNTTGLSHKPLTTVERFQWGSGLAGFWDRGIKLAMVGRPDQFDSERFGKLVALNRALHYGSYIDEADALQWLLKAREG